MKELQSDEDAYKRQFSQYIKNGVTPDSIEAMYKKAHAKIREAPEHQSSAKTKPEGYKQKRWTKAKLLKSQRDDKVRQKKASFLKKLSAGANE